MTNACRRTSRGANCAFFLSFILVSLFQSGTALAQTVLHFPRVISTDALSTGIAISNPTPLPATLTLTALEADGTLLVTTGENPVSLVVPADGQITRNFPELFAGSTNFNGWIEATSETSGLMGFYLNGSSSLGDLDGAAVKEPATEFLLPFVTEDEAGTTEVTLVNPSPEPTVATATLFAASGSNLGSTSLNIPGRGLLRQTLTTVSEGIDRAGASHVLVVSERPLLGLELVADFAVPEPTEFRRETVQLTGQSVDGSTTSVLSQFVSGVGWISHLGVVNAGGIGQQVTLTAFRSDGTPWQTDNNPARLVLEANESTRVSVGPLFGFDPGLLRTGWIEVVADVGHVATFIGLGNAATASFALVSGTDRTSASRQLAFSHFADGSDFFTGLTINNVEQNEANIELYVIREDGTTLGRALVSVPGRQTVSGLFSDFVPASFDQARVWAFIRSSEPVIATALMGTVNGTSLANLNPQIPQGTFVPPVQVTASIAGEVEQSGIGVADVTMNLTGPVNATVKTHRDGRYVFSQLIPGDYTVTPSRAGAEFVPEQRSVTLALENVDDVDFESGGIEPASVPTINFVTPSAIFAGNNSLNLTVGGGDFSPTSVVRINGVALQTTFVNAVELKAILPAELSAQPSMLTLTVQTPAPGGGVSDALEFRVNEALSNPLIEGRVDVGPFPAGVAIDPGSGLALVASEGGDVVLFVDPGELKTVGQVKVGRSPTEIDIDPVNNLAVVANVGSNDVSVIDIPSRSVVATVSVGRFPMGVALVPGRKMDLVVNGEDDNVSVVDLESFSVTRTIQVGARPAGVAINPRTNQAVVTHRGTPEASIIDLTTFAVVGRIPTGEFSRAVAINPESNQAVIVNSNGGDVTLADLEGRVILQTIPVGAGPTAVAIDTTTGNAVVTNSGFVRGFGSLGNITTVVVVNLSQSEIIAEVPVGSTAFGVDVDPARRRAVVSNFGSNDVTVLQLPNPQPRISGIEPKEFPVGVPSFTIAISGTGFLPTSVVTLNGRTLATTFVSSTELLAEVTEEILNEILQTQSIQQGIGLDDNVTADVFRQLAPVNFNIGVTNPGPGGGGSPPPSDPDANQITPNNPTPVLTSLAPSEGEAGKDVVLTLRGNNFNATSVIAFSGSLHSPGVSSPKALTVRIPASDVTPGEHTVTVTNPSADGAKVSGVLTFTAFDKKNPRPQVSRVDPPEVEAGAGAVGITITGTGFIESTSVRLAGASAIVIADSRTLSFTLSAEALGEPGRLNGFVTNAGPGGGSSPFAIRITGAPPTDLGHRRFGVQRLDQGVRLVGQLGEGEKVVEAEAVRGLPLVTVAVEPREGDVVPAEAADLVFPHGRLDGADPEFCGGLVVVRSHC